MHGVQGKKNVGELSTATQPTSNQCLALNDSTSWAVIAEQKQTNEVGDLFAQHPIVTVYMTVQISFYTPICFMLLRTLQVLFQFPDVFIALKFITMMLWQLYILQGSKF